MNFFQITFGATDRVPGLMKAALLKRDFSTLSPIPGGWVSVGAIAVSGIFWGDELLCWIRRNLSAFEGIEECDE